MTHIYELVLAAVINLDTAVKQNPAIKGHPVFAIALAQLGEAKALIENGPPNLFLQKPAILPNKVAREAIITSSINWYDAMSKMAHATEIEREYFALLAAEGRLMLKELGVEK